MLHADLVGGNKAPHPRTHITFLGRGPLDQVPHILFSFFFVFQNLTVIWKTKIISEVF
jgi:hypothetical protein